MLHRGKGALSLLNLDVLVAKTEPDPQISKRKRKGHLRRSLDVVIAAVTVPFWSSHPSLMYPMAVVMSNRHSSSRCSRVIIHAVSNHVPNIFGRIAELSARDARTQAKVADADGVVLDVVCKVVLPLGHRTNKHADTLLGSQVRDVVCHSNDFCVIAEGDFATIHRKVIGDWILDHFE